MPITVVGRRSFKALEVGDLLHGAAAGVQLAGAVRVDEEDMSVFVFGVEHAGIIELLEARRSRLRPFSNRPGSSTMWLSGKRLAV